MQILPLLSLHVHAAVYIFTGVALNLEVRAARIRTTDCFYYLLINFFSIEPATHKKDRGIGK